MRQGVSLSFSKEIQSKLFPKALKTLPKMDLIFIDGGHSYTTVKSNWENSKTLMHNKTAVFFHNYDFSGPQKVVNNISREKYQVKIIHPKSDYDTALVKKKSKSTVKEVESFSQKSTEISRYI